MKFKALITITIIITMLFTSKETAALSTVDEGTIKIDTIYQTIQQAQYMKVVCNYFYKNKHELDLIYSNSNINNFEYYIPSEQNSLLKYYKDKKQFNIFIEKLSTQQKDILTKTCNIEFPKTLQKIKSNSKDWILLVKEDMEKAAEEYKKLDALNKSE
jgi:hypothetical protein